MQCLNDIATFTGGHLTGNPTCEVSGVQHAAQQCEPGFLFAAVQGARADGHSFISHALERGAVGVISERPCPPDFVSNWIQVPNIRLAMAQAAAVTYGHPSRELKLVGVTGTNGKTTTAYVLDAIFRAAFGNRSAMMGTVEYRIGDHRETAHHTTPEATEIQRFLRKAVTAGCSHAVMEVSSVAIDLHRVSALTFDTAIFSNLTQDHLDYHKTMEAYFDAKQRLFDGRLRPQPHNLVLNLDDAFGERLFRETNGAARKISYGIGNVAERNLDVGVEQYEVTGHGLVLDVHTVAGRFELKSFLIGRPHVYNLLASTAAALAVGIAPEAIVAGVAVAQVPGRFERVDDGSHGFTVVVDYAHTPDAIVNALGAARAIVEPHNGRVVTVFGCGGDRDRGKRPLMAEAAATHSDIIIATSDNPRNESPEQILDDVEIGLRRVGKPFHRFVDRRQAIGCAIEQARPGDLVVIAGKGHETYQILGPTTIHFDDREVAREALDGLKAEASYAHS